MRSTTKSSQNLNHKTTRISDYLSSRQGTEKSIKKQNTLATLARGRDKNSNTLAHYKASLGSELEFL